MDITSLFFKIKSWSDFNDELVHLNKKQKGDAFELLTKLYFEIDHKYNNYDNIWLLSEIPKKDLEIIGLESRDLGIDLIAKKGDEYHAIQCKYHTDKYQNVTFKEVSTFLSNLGGYEKLTEGYICSSAISTSKNYDAIKKKSVSKILSDTWSNLDEDFFNRIKKYLRKEKYSPTPFYPRAHQEKATNQAYEHFIKNKESRGKLIFPCGAGKSLTGFWMMEKLGAISTVIAVPSLSLVKQTLDVYLKEIVARDIKVNWLCICSDEGIGTNTEIKFKTEDIGVPCKTDPEYIRQWLKENKDSRNVIFTTYQSSRLIAEISKELNHTFDLGILDEAHKTVGDSDKLFSYLLFEKNISIKSRIFMTATERFYSGSKDDIVSMDDTDIYGDIFAQMSFKEAIDLKLLTDYKIITIDIKKSEISEFIKDNGLVELNTVWKKETESRSLASMLALRKAMKQFSIKNAVSFHSSIEKARRNKDIHSHITTNYGYEPIDTYTVSGKDKTSKRNDIIQEFASSEKALITNARCLTEGVDVPNIDCIVFADPKKSKIDIVQALGRALRIKEGKDWGYVILPVIYDGDTNEIDNDNFNEILAIVRGLAANDERIVEYFKEKSLPKSGQKGGGAEVFSMISETLSESDFAEQLNIRIWEKLSKFNWMPFEEARELVRKLKIKSQNEFWDKHKAGLIPKNIPFSPYNIYKNSGWISYPDFLGYESLFRELLSYEESKKIVQKLELKSSTDWNKLDKSTIQSNIPKRPNSYYKDKGWVSWADWLGFKGRRKNNAKYLDYGIAKKFVHKLKLNSTTDWRNYSKTDEIPINIPKYPRAVYKNSGWLSMGDWLGTSSVADQYKTYLSFKEARDFVRTLHLNNGKEWVNYVNINKIQNIPKRCDQTYEKEGWSGWKDFLGTKNKKKFEPYEKAQEWALQNKIKTKKEWKEHTLRPDCFPKNPDYSAEYKSKWISWEIFLQKKDDYLNFEEARSYVRALSLINQKEWRAFCKSKSFPIFIPKSPKKYYKNKGWLSLGDWLGTGRIADQNKVFIPFKQVKLLVKNKGIKTQKQWYDYAKSGGNKPEDVPYKPHRTYKEKGWKGWDDFLGK